MCSSLCIVRFFSHHSANPSSVPVTGCGQEGGMCLLGTGVLGVPIASLPQCPGTNLGGGVG